MVRDPFRPVSPWLGWPFQTSVWSDTAVAPTLLEGLGLCHHDCRNNWTAASMPPPASTGSPGVFYLVGCSVLSSTPPKHAFMSCAFDNACAGLVMEREPTPSAPAGKHGKHAMWKVIVRKEAQRLEAYALDEDVYEDVDRSGELTDSERNRSHLAMRAWASAVQTFWKNPRKKGHRMSEANTLDRATKA